MMKKSWKNLEAKLSNCHFLFIVKFQMYSESSSLYNSETPHYSESTTTKYSDSHTNTYSSDSSTTRKKVRPLDPPEDLYPLDSVWTPSQQFPGLFVSVDEKGDCVLSGPRELLETARQQIHDIVLNNLNIDITNDIRTIEFVGEP